MKPLRVCILALALALVLSFSAFSQSQQRGVVIDTVVCSHAKQQSYALYLPSNYDSTKSWPVIFIFEPAARGSLPVNQFKEAAEELGYVLLGSNNSRNGSWDIAFDAADAMFVDAFARYNIDSERVYTSGFSGGSRVSSAIARITGKINGVIACGAGFSTAEEYQLEKNSSVFYAAVVGNQDMNYQEHRQLESELDNRNVENTRIIFNNGHQWPNSVYLKEALYWMELQCSKNNKSTSSQFAVDRAYELTKSRADSTFNNGNYVLAAEIYKSLIADYEGLIDIEPLKLKLDSLAQEKEYKKQLKQQEKINERELDYRKELGDAFTELYFTKLKVGNDSELRGMAWWESKVDFFKKLSNKDDFQTRNMALRLLNVIWARCAESSFNYMSMNDYEMAQVLTKIWLYTQPNLWGKWNMAKVLAFQGDTLFFSYLQEVVENSTRLTQQSIRKEKAFQDYMDHQQMQIILSQLK